MKLKTDASALITAAAFGTATFLMMMLNKNGETSSLSSNETSERVTRSLYDFDADEAADEALGNCDYFRLDDEDCPITDDNDEDDDDVAQFADDQPAVRARRKMKLYTVGDYWAKNNKDLFTRILGTIQASQAKKLTKTPKRRALEFENNEDNTFLLSEDEPWWSGDFAEYNNKCQKNGDKTMVESYLKSFNIFYPQHLIYDANVSVEQQMELWNAYKQFNAKVSFEMGEAADSQSRINLFGYRGTAFQPPTRIIASAVKNQGTFGAWKNYLDGRAYGQLKDNGFIVPARRNRKNTIVLNQPRFKSFNDHWANFVGRERVGAMDVTSETCINVIIMHNLFFDASVLDSWVPGGRGREQVKLEENIQKCQNIPVMITPSTSGRSASFEDWMRSIAAGLVPSTELYAQSHLDKKQFHVMTPEYFINNVNKVAEQVSMWSCAINNRAQCQNTVNPDDFAEDDFRAVTEPVSTTAALEETTTTEWSTSAGPFVSETPVAETEGPEFTTTTGPATTGEILSTYCCFANPESSYGTYETCPEENPLYAV